MDGTNREDLPSPTVNANGATFRRNDVTNDHTLDLLRRSATRRAAPTTHAIERNRIHDCGRLPAANHDHGIYVEDATDTRIAATGSTTTPTAASSSIPTPSARDVARNVIDGNGEGIIFSGEYGVPRATTWSRTTSSPTAGCATTSSSWFAPRQPDRRGNVVRNNCIGGGAYDSGNGGIGDQRGFRVVGTIAHAGRPTRTAPRMTSGSQRAVPAAS